MKREGIGRVSATLVGGRVFLYSGYPPSVVLRLDDSAVQRKVLARHSAGQIVPIAHQVVVVLGYLLAAEDSIYDVVRRCSWYVDTDELTDTGGPLEFSTRLETKIREMAETSTKSSLTPAGYSGFLTRRTDPASANVN